MIKDYYRLKSEEHSKEMGRGGFVTMICWDTMIRWDTMIIAIRLLIAAGRSLAFDAAISIILTLSFERVFLPRAAWATAWRVGEHVVILLELARWPLGTGAEILVTLLPQDLFSAFVDIIRLKTDATHSSILSFPIQGAFV